jgi:cytochrome c oxidase subunit 1
MIFSFLTFFVGIPSGIKIFNWVATMYKGSISLKTPMMYAIAFLLLFTIGGLTGVFLGAISVDVHLHDTYFVVAHFHYVMMGGTVMALLGGIHYWWPKMFGRRYSEFWGRIASVIIFVGFNVAFMSQFLMGSRGMPRRYYTYPEQYAEMHGVSTVGAYILGIGFLIMFIYLIHSLFRGQRVGPNPWGSLTMEWETSSPPHPHNFEEDKRLEHGPYDYDQIEVEEEAVKP